MPVSGQPRYLKARSALACFALALAGSALTGGSALAATPDTPFGAVTLRPPQIQDRGLFGERMAAAKYDYNGDGVNDVFVGYGQGDVGKNRGQGRVYLLSGKQLARGTTETSAVLRTFNDPEPQAYAGFGRAVSVVGDVSGDGKPDIAVGAPDQDEAGADRFTGGTVWVMNGATGKAVQRLYNPNPQFGSRYAERVTRAGDITGDGASEVLVGASSQHDPTGCGFTEERPCSISEGKAYVFNPTNGSLVRTLRMPREDIPEGGCRYNCSFGLAVQGPGDTNGDGVDDQLVAAPYFRDAAGAAGRLYLFSGKTGEVLHKIDSPQPDKSDAFFGFADAAPRSPGDVTDDGNADVYGASFDQDGTAGKSQGKAWVFNGRTGEPLYALDDPSPEEGGQFGWSMDRTDYNNDGTPDLYIGQSPHHVSTSSAQGGTYVMNGANGSLLKALEVPKTCEQPSSRQNRGPALGWSLAAPGDLNADGDPDYVGGAPFFDIPQGKDPYSGDKRDQGLLFTFLSKPGSLPTPCEDLGSG
jgi:hypothetical protein